jgi:ribosome-associated translation inhibitor RaiA
MDSSPAVETVVHKSVERLERVHPGILACQVVIEAPHQHHRQGRHFRVLVHVTIPGGEIVASRSPTLDDSHDDVYVAIRDAFAAVRRELAERGDRAHTSTTP